MHTGGRLTPIYPFQQSKSGTEVLGVWIWRVSQLPGVSLLYAFRDPFPLFSRLPSRPSVIAAAALSCLTTRQIRRKQIVPAQKGIFAGTVPRELLEHNVYAHVVF